MSAFIPGLKEGELHTSLIKKAPRSFDDLLQRANKYVNLEESINMKKGEAGAKLDKPKEVDRTKKEGETRGRARMAPGKEVRRGPRYDTYTPLVASHERVLMENWEHPALRWPKLGPLGLKSHQPSAMRSCASFTMSMGTILKNALI